MISSYTIFANNPGKSILIFGAIHGNEKCGTLAINKIIKEIDDGIIDIKKGTITFVPVCNQKAYENNVRYIDKNLNRVFRKTDSPQSYEEGLANELCDLVDKTDVLLDIHSIDSEGRPFVFQDYSDPITDTWAKNLGFEYAVTGWPEMCAETADSDTIGYAHSKGKMGTLIECGNHNHPEATDIAYNAIKRTLVYFGIIENGGNVGLKTPIITRAYTIYKKDRPGDFVKTWAHLDEVKGGELIARYDDGSEIIMPHDGHILLPNATTQIGDEWFYIGLSEK